MKSDRGYWMQTFTGRAFYFEDPRPDEIDIRDIAHGLSNLCRFGGHCKRFYSVAEHSVLVSLQVPREHALQALLHDATEAYVVDVPRPLKRLLGENYEAIEGRAWGAIAKAMGVPVAMDPSVKVADNTVLLAERDVLLGPTPIEWEWARGIAPAKVLVYGYSPEVAKLLFLRRFAELTKCRLVDEALFN